MSIVMDKYDVLEEEQNLKYFSTAFGLSQALGAIAVMMVAVWMGTYDGGFGWGENAPDQMFHYHPLFMTIGMLFIYGEAILVYRVFRHERKMVIKLLHAALHAGVFIFMAIALRAVFGSHDYKQPSIPNMYSLHSWVGLGTALMFCSQFICGFVTYLFPGLSMPVRQWYMPIHRFAGLMLFIFAVCAAEMGISERAAYHIKNWPERPPEGILVNFLGVIILLYGLTVVYIVANPRFRRRALPEEESLQQLTTAD